MATITDPNGTVSGNDHVARALTDEPREPDHVRKYMFEGPGAISFSHMMTCEQARVCVELIDTAYLKGRHAVRSAIREALDI